MPFGSGIDPTKGEPLPLGTAAVLECVVRELSVVAVVVEDADAVLLSKVLECSFSFYCLFGGKLGHKVNVLEP
jgi:hypothetical protein